MKFYAVIDTNVIVSSMLKHDSVPGTILDLVTNKTIIPILNEEILTEYQDVLTRNKFGFNKIDIDTFIDGIRANSILLDRQKTIEDYIDEDDIVFYEIVMSARNTMDAYLITGNIKHFPKKSFVVTPKEMLDIVSQKIMSDSTLLK